MKHFFLFFIGCLFFSFKAEANPTLPPRDPFTPAAQLHENMLESRWIPLYFTTAETIAHLIDKTSLQLLSSQGQLMADDHSNQIWLQDDSDHVKKIQAIIAHLDQPGPQFVIKAKIINVDRDHQKALGFLFNTARQSPTAPNDFFVDQPNSRENPGEFSLSLMKLAEHDLLEMQISALEEEGHANVIASPSLTTLNNQAAIIESGAEVPYQETSLSGGTSTNFKKAVLRLKVTPKAMPNNHILLTIELNQDKVSSLRIKEVPAIETQQITTKVIVKNTQTLVLGGILETEETKTTEGIPVLNALPLMGKLFEHQASLKKHEELLIFITPTMIESL